ncbi:MAG: hypothetical protein ABI811_11110 [Acidobacteriota bacterium]
MEHWFQLGLMAVQMLTTCGLVFWMNRRIERLKSEILLTATVRVEKREVYFQLLGVLGAMRDAADSFRVGPDKEAAGSQLDKSRTELFRMAPSAALVLGSTVGSAFEAYRRIAQPALAIDPLGQERWKLECDAIGAAIEELIRHGRQDLGYADPLR